MHFRYRDGGVPSFYMKEYCQKNNSIMDCLSLDFLVSNTIFSFLTLDFHLLTSIFHILTSR